MIGRTILVSSDHEHSKRNREGERPNSVPVEPHQTETDHTAQVKTYSIAPLAKAEPFALWHWRCLGLH